MFRIRKITDELTPSNKEAVKQVLEILRNQFPNARPIEFTRLPNQLIDPIKYHYRSILMVAEDNMSRVRGFAMLSHMIDVGIIYLELISAAPGKTGGGIGSALYERVREEAKALRTIGIFFECSVDDETVVRNPEVLKQNIARLKFYERYGARPIINNLYATPVNPGDQDLYYLVYDGLGHSHSLRLKQTQRAVRAILERKYGDIIPPEQISEVVNSFKDDPVSLRKPVYRSVKKSSATPISPTERGIALVVNEGHDIHHVKDRGYVEVPVRLSNILHQLKKTKLFTRLNPKRVSEKHIKEVHESHFVDYLRRTCATLPSRKSIYPIVFPIRNLSRPPKDIELQVGYYCIDTFTPLHRNAYPAARGAVDCAVTAADAVINGYLIAYALVRPPGHHAEKRAFGGFCYFNSAAVAANYLSKYGRVAVLDIDFHHGNGTQNIFYDRSDVLTISIHGDPTFAYPHFAGFSDEQGEGEGLGFNINYPMPENISVAQYQKTLARALSDIEKFSPAYLVVALGLDTAKSDPTGTWKLAANDFRINGIMIGEKKWPTIVVQEGGYRTQTLGINARMFFEGLWNGYKGTSTANSDVSKTSKKKSSGTV